MFPEAKIHGLERENVKRTWHGSEKLLENFLRHENQEGPRASMRGVTTNVGDLVGI